MLEISVKPEVEKTSNIKVIGVGGAGNKAITRMKQDGIDYVELIGVNTAVKDLSTCEGTILQIGEKLTHGLGAGAKPQVGEKAAEESRAELENAVAGADMVIVTCGMGGGTGTGASPVIADLAKKKGILTVGVVTKPFGFEGSVRRKNAEQGIQRLKDTADAMIVIPNDKLLAVADKNMTSQEAYRKGDEVLRQTIQTITEIINVPADINVDMADITTVMRNKGLAYTGIGDAKGDQKAIRAMEMAITSPFLETNVRQASDVIISITGDITLYDAKEAVNHIACKTSLNTNIIFGFRYDVSTPDACRISVIATGIQSKLV
ncbi:MAG: cell division protein FtsZ [Lachnospiraceae bacterium]|nr:cell division protein FtsZ [Lachnospiraceae bacterium]